MEAYPTLKTRIGLPPLPPVAVGFGALLVAALALFLAPMLLFPKSDGGGIGGAPTATPSAAASESTAPTPSAQPTPEVYVVKSGDTLSTIATRLGVPLDELISANPQIKDPNKIGLGDRVNIPSRAPSEVTDASASPSASGP